VYVDINKIKPPNLIIELKEKNKSIVGCIGRFVNEKRYADVIEAAYVLTRTNADIHFVLVGGRGEIDKYRSIVEEKRLQEYISFTGELSNPMAFLKGFDLFLLASSSEGMPNVVMEAMLLGKPVIATNVGGIPDLIEDKVGGLLIPPFRTDKITEAIDFLLKNKNTATQYALCSLERINDFSIEKLLSTVETMYNEILTRS